MKLPMVEIFETVEGEGLRAGFPTTFVRVFNCNLRCTWCDTTYSYAPSKPEFFSTLEEIIQKVTEFGNVNVCLTGGEPLMHGEKSLQLIEQLASLSFIEDIHIETNGAISLEPFAELREKDTNVKKKMRFIMDYKLPASGEIEKMIGENFTYLDQQDEVKFVIQDRNDYEVAVKVYKNLQQKGTGLFSPVWGKMAPDTLVNWILADKLKKVKLNLQTHKFIWDPDLRGV
ncbi:7-carboxy-7-deazaguanine synthase QueE [Shimazuella kribbensis]|uniref:7-carboxy-7-deazaguanine synthase QueE n=1 Tax=Shimazuella kribbensis TaxID=139808 RepID=UPI000420EBCA|nr:radical SAM protein [Shimazuella kribbensis]